MYFPSEIPSNFSPTLSSIDALIMYLQHLDYLPSRHIYHRKRMAALI